MRCKPAFRLATVSRVLRRAGLSRLRDLVPPEPVVRYEYKEPGGLIHLDIKKLGRFERVWPPDHWRSHRPEQRARRGLGSSHGPPLVRGAAIGAPSVQAPMAAARVHICIDDASRIAVTGIYPDEKAVSAIAALHAAVACYQRLGVTVTRVMPPSRRLKAIACPLPASAGLPAQEGGNGQWLVL